jgi:hypothetical protein
MCFNLVPLRNTTNIELKGALSLTTAHGVLYLSTPHMKVSRKCFKPIRLRNFINVGLKNCIKVGASQR